MTPLRSILAVAAAACVFAGASQALAQAAAAPPAQLGALAPNNLI